MRGTTFGEASGLGVFGGGDTKEATATRDGPATVLIKARGALAAGNVGADLFALAWDPVALDSRRTVAAACADLVALGRATSGADAHGFFDACFLRRCAALADLHEPFV